jgi:hypothetical protein
LSVEKGKDAWGKPCKKNISEVSFIGSGSLRKCKIRKRRRRQEVQVGDSVYPACALKITSDDVNAIGYYKSTAICSI